MKVENGLFIRQLASHCLHPADFDGSDETNGTKLLLHHMTSFMLPVTFPRGKLLFPRAFQLVSMVLHLIQQRAAGLACQGLGATTHVLERSACHVPQQSRCGPQWSTAGGRDCCAKELTDSTSSPTFGKVRPCSWKAPWSQQVAGTQGLGSKNCKLNWALSPEELKAKISPSLVFQGKYNFHWK